MGVPGFSLNVRYCIVLMGWSLLPHALRPFQIYCAPPNLGIMTWICRIHFVQRPIFQDWGSLTSLKSQTRDPQLKVPPGGLVLMIFMSCKNPSSSAGFEPVNLGSRGEHVTPRPLRPTKRNLRRRRRRKVFTDDRNIWNFLLLEIDWARNITRIKDINTWSLHGLSEKQ